MKRVDYLEFIFRNMFGLCGLKSFMATDFQTLSMAYKASRDGLTQPDLNLDQCVMAIDTGHRNMGSKLGLWLLVCRPVL